MGAMIYFAGNNFLLNQEVNKLKARINKVIDDLPDLMRDLPNQSKPTAVAPSLDQQTPIAPQPGDALEQRMQALDSKLDLLIKHVHGSSSPSQGPAQTAPQPNLPASLSRTRSNEPAEVAPAADGELHEIRNMLLQLVEAMAVRQDSPGNPPPQPSVLHPPSVQAESANDRKLSIEELRA
ncbi:MAG: hypothetical protein ACP5OY_05010, partial [Halothiobacillaceae bacterium]